MITNYNKRSSKPNNYAVYHLQIFLYSNQSLAHTLAQQSVIHQVRKIHIHGEDILIQKTSISIETFKY